MGGEGGSRAVDKTQQDQEELLEHLLPWLFPLGLLPVLALDAGTQLSAAPAHTAISRCRIPNNHASQPKKVPIDFLCCKLIQIISVVSGVH